MFCARCGEALEQGAAFCNNCGAKALQEGDTGAATGAPGPDVTAVRPPAAPPPPPQATPAGYSGGWTPTQGPSGPGSRSGLIWGIVAAVIILLAGAGVGVYFGAVRDSDDGTAKTSTTEVGSSGTTDGVTTSMDGPTTSTGTGTSSTVAGSSTTQTIPGLTTTTSGPDTTEVGGDWRERYFAAAADLLSEVEDDDERIPELATEINNSAPNVPTWVRDELSTMLDTLDALNMELAALDVPEGFEEADRWLQGAVMHMANRVDATVKGLEIMWDTGKVGSAEAFFNDGRAERDAYRAAIQKYYEFLPIE